MDGFLPLLPGQLRTGTSVAAVDAPARRVTLASGESIGYQNLVVHGAVAPSRANARGVRAFRRA